MCICDHAPGHIMQVVTREEGMRVWSSSWGTLWGEA